VTDGAYVDVWLATDEFFLGHRSKPLCEAGLMPALPTSEPTIGIEPTTPSLPRTCSTD
jgi:hypothetical protein